jgi:alcohol dehydrogenase class IV
MEAIRLIGKNLVEGVKAPDNVAACEPLMFAGMLAGIGFRRSSVCTAFR